MAPISQLNQSPQNNPTPTFHDAIQHFIRPPNPNAKPAVLTLKRRSKKREPTSVKPEFNLSQESAEPYQEDTTPRKFERSSRALKFKSQAVMCEVKFAEMLTRAKARQKPSSPGKYGEAPDAYRAGVCCQLLYEICGMAIPFTRVLYAVHSELEQAIYSNYVTPSSSAPFEQIPYFEVVSSLEKKNEETKQELEKWKVLLAQKQLEVDDSKALLEESNKQITKEQKTVSELQHNLTSTARSLEKSNKEVARLTDQIAKSRLEVFQAREMKCQLEQAEAKYENLMAKHINIVHELQHYQSNLEVARKEAADGVPKREMAAAKTQIKDLQHKLLKYDLLLDQMQTMTPRPQWALLRGGSCYVMSTAAQAAEICKLNDLLLENVTSLRLECATAQVALAEVKQQQKKSGRPASPPPALKPSLKNSRGLRAHKKKSVE